TQPSGAQRGPGRWPRRRGVHAPLGLTVTRRSTWAGAMAPATGPESESKPSEPRTLNVGRGDGPGDGRPLLDRLVAGPAALNVGRGDGPGDGATSSGSAPSGPT